VKHLGHPPQPWLQPSTVVALEMLVRGEGLPFPDPFSELHPQEIASIAAQIKLESLPNDLLDLASSYRRYSFDSATLG